MLEKEWKVHAGEGVESVCLRRIGRWMLEIGRWMLEKEWKVDAWKGLECLRGKRRCMLEKD